MSPSGGAWTWRFVDPGGRDVAEPAIEAASRFEAEAWLGESWRAIARRGAARAVLLHGAEPVGPVVELREYRLVGRAEAVAESSELPP